MSVQVQVLDASGASGIGVYHRHLPVERPNLVTPDGDLSKENGGNISREAQYLRITAEALMSRYENIRRGNLNARRMANVVDFPIGTALEDYITRGLRSVIELLRVLETDRSLADRALELLFQYDAYINVMLMAVAGICAVLYLSEVCCGSAQTIREVKKLYSYIENSRLKERYKKLLVEIDNMSQRLMRVTQKPLTSEEMVEIELWLIGMQSSVNRVRELHRKTQAKLKLAIGALEGLLAWTTPSRVAVVTIASGAFAAVGYQMGQSLLPNIGPGVLSGIMACVAPVGSILFHQWQVRQVHDQISVLDDIQTDLELNEDDLKAAANEVSRRLRHHGVRAPSLVSPDWDAYSISSALDLKQQ